MKKLTAGIFAGILTIVSVNAARADIATSGYVKQQVNAVDAKVGTLNSLSTKDQTSTVAAINEVVGNVSDNKTSIDNLKNTVDGLTSGDNSVADQIAKAIGDGIPEGSDVSKELAKKANTADLGTMASKSADDYSTTAQMNTELDKKQNNLNTDQLAAVNSGITTENVAQITTNKNDIAGIKTNIGTLPEGETSVVTMIQKVEAAAGTDLTDKLGEGFPEGSTVKAELDKKQNMLNNTNVTTGGEGNAIVSITAVDGVVTATKGAVMPAVPATAKGETGTFVLTATVNETGVANYMWEQIERGTPAE